MDKVRALYYSKTIRPFKIQFYHDDEGEPEPISGTYFIYINRYIDKQVWICFDETHGFDDWGQNEEYGDNCPHFSELVRTRRKRVVEWSDWKLINRPP